MPEITWIDTHCHLDAAEFDADRSAVHAQARAAGVARLVIPAVAPAHWPGVRALAQHGRWAHRLWVPEDGECRYYPGPTVKSNAMNSVAAEA